MFNPAFYLYISSLTDKNFRLKYIQLLHLLPFLFFEIGAYVIKETISVRSFLHADTTLGFRLAFGLATFISLMIYNSLSLIRVTRHRRNLKNEFSTIENYISLGWLLFIIVFYNVYCVVSFVIGGTHIFQGSNLMLPHIFNYSALLFMVYAFGFYGFWQKPIYTRRARKKYQGVTGIPFSVHGKRMK